MKSKSISVKRLVEYAMEYCTESTPRKIQEINSFIDFVKEKSWKLGKLNSNNLEG